MLAALALSSMAFANTSSRAFDVHVPRMAFELAVYFALASARRRTAPWSWIFAPAALIAGFRFAPNPSDGPLFLIGVSGLIAGAAAGEARDRGARTPVALLAGLTAAAVVSALLLVTGNGVHWSYLAGETAQAAPAAGGGLLARGGAAFSRIRRGCFSRHAGGR
ncbi:MAG: hypothetical protein M5R36_11745 [Deltaproteobacteria bacterium]|nr:hypothetical protein [Deltaproteobacteria bacterium]